MRRFVGIESASTEKRIQTRLFRPSLAGSRRMRRLSWSLFKMYQEVRLQKLVSKVRGKLAPGERGLSEIVRVINPRTYLPSRFLYLVNGMLEVLGVASGAVMFFGFLGTALVIFPYLIGRLGTTWDHLAPGTNRILVSLGILGFALLWQWLDLKSFFEHPDRFTGARRLMGLVVLVGLLVGAWLVFAQTVYYNSTGELQMWAASQCDRLCVWPAKPMEPAFVKVIETAGNALFAAALLVTPAFIVLMLGKFTSGLALAAATHNYFNGLGFDISVIFDLLFEVGLPDLWAGALIAGNFLLSMYMTRRSY
jgi:hypothetical protein